MIITASRRDFVTGTAGSLAALALTRPAAAEVKSAGDELSAIPELAPHWKKLDLAKILRRLESNHP